MAGSRETIPARNAGLTAPEFTQESGLSAGSTAQPVRVATYVVGFDRPVAAYRIRRGPGLVPLGFNLLLVNGDVIEVLDPSATLGIRCIDRTAVVVTRGMSPLPVWTQASEPSTAGNAGRPASGHRSRERFWGEAAAFFGPSATNSPGTRVISRRCSRKKKEDVRFPESSRTRLQFGHDTR